MLETVLQTFLLSLISIISGFLINSLSMWFSLSFVFIIFFYLGVRSRLRYKYKEEAMYIITLRETNMGLLISVISLGINIIFTVFYFYNK